MRITPDLWINPAFVSDMTVDRRHYMNGQGPSTLVIVMMDGREHRIRHEPQYYGGADIYAIQTQIEAALQSQEPSP